jgi:hypothetical protein
MRTLAKALGATLALVLFAATPANAAFGLKDFSLTFDNEDDSAARLAGSHPYGATTSFRVNTKTDPAFSKEIPDGDVKSVRFHFPPGFIGSTTAVPRCATADFLTVDENGYPACADSTALGEARISVLEASSSLGEPMYNLVPPPGVAVKLGFIAFNIPITVEVGINEEAPNNVIASQVNTPQVVEFYGGSFRVWGVPAAHSHDSLRGRCLSHPLGEDGKPASAGICNTSAAEVPFLTLPRSCTGPLSSSYEAVSWQEPNAKPDEGSYEAPGMIGCSNLSLLPQVSVKPTATQAEAASGLDFEMDIHDEGIINPSGLAQSDVKKVVVALPAGMTVNPSSANGLAVCPRAGYEAESLATPPGAGCPQASRIGEVQAESPLLPEGEVLRGQVFIASQDDNPFGSLLALYLVVKNPELGIFIKRALKVEPSEEQGPNAGRLVTTFDDFPQAPISHASFHFKEGARGPLLTPPACNAPDRPYVTESQFTPWANPSEPFVILSTFDITSGVNGGPCPPGGVPPFHPGFSAGSLNNNAGAYSPFNLRLTRSDGEQEMTRFDAVLPKGVTGKLAGISKCPESAIAAAKAKSGRTELASPSCPANSEIGHTLAGAGVGSVLTYVPGKLYLAGPFAGDPLSVIAITPAVAGPFDVGTIVVHEALDVDPETLEIKVDGAHSDPIPHILKGLPVKAKDLRVYTDRPNFTLNPTSCAKKEAKATLFGSFLDVFNPGDDVGVPLSDRYQAASCASLKFKPNLSFRLKGGTRRGAHPALKTVLTYPKGGGYANTAKAVVTFPHSEFLEQAHIRTVCTRVQFAAKQCPPGSIYGHVKATSPLVEETLEGPVYLRSSSHPLPDIVFALHGIVDANVVTRIDSTNARIRATVDSAPDIPVSKFVLEMQGGKKGLFVNSRNLCAAPARALAELTAQNGKSFDQKPLMQVSCGGKGKRTKRG